MLAQRCRSLTFGSCLSPPSLPPGSGALPAPPLPASFSHNWQQTAGGEACDPSSRLSRGDCGPARAPWRSLGARASSTKPEESSLRTPGPPATRRIPKSLAPIPAPDPARPAPLVPAPGAARHFPGSGLGARPSPRAAPSPSAARTSAPPAPARSPPAHPSLRTRPLSLRRALPFYPRVSCPWHRVQMLQAPGWPPGLGAVGRPGTGRPERARLPRTRPPARLLRSCTPSGHIPPRRSSARGSPGSAARPGQAGIRAPPPESSAPPARAPVRPAPLSGLGSDLRTHPALRSPPAPGALWRAGARRGFNTASEILRPLLPDSSVTPNPSRTTAFRSPAPALAGRGRTALGASRS